VLDQLPPHLKGSERYKNEELLQEIPDTIVEQYLTRYEKNTGDYSCYIEIPAGEGELSSIANIIAETQNVFLNCFLYDAKTKELNYKGSFGNKNMGKVGSILYNRFHFWTLYHPEENEWRRKGIFQAAKNATTLDEFIIPLPLKIN